MDILSPLIQRTLAQMAKRLRNSAIPGLNPALSGSYEIDLNIRGIFPNNEAVAQMAVRLTFMYDQDFLSGITNDCVVLFLLRLNGPRARSSLGLCQSISLCKSKYLRMVISAS